MKLLKARDRERWVASAIGGNRAEPKDTVEFLLINQVMLGLTGLTVGLRGSGEKGNNVSRQALILSIRPSVETFGDK